MLVTDGHEYQRTAGSIALRSHTIAGPGANTPRPKACSLARVHSPGLKIDTHLRGQLQ
jgi:hypothetical protein